MKNLIYITILCVMAITGCSSVSDPMNNPPNWINQPTINMDENKVKRFLGGPSSSYDNAIIEARSALADVIYYKLNTDEIVFNSIFTDEIKRDADSSYAKILSNSTTVVLIGAQEIDRWKNTDTGEYYVLFEISIDDYQKSTKATELKLKEENNNRTKIDNYRIDLYENMSNYNNSIIASQISPNTIGNNGMLNINIPNLEKEDSFSFYGYVSQEQQVDQFKLVVDGLLPKRYYILAQPNNSKSDIGIEIQSLGIGIYNKYIDCYGKGISESKSIFLLPGTYSINVKYVRGEDGNYLFKCEH